MRKNQSTHLLLLAIPLLAGCGGPPFNPRKVFSTHGFIERLNVRIDRIVPLDARMEKIAEGFEWAEGPVWVQEMDCLLFSDIPRNTIFRWTESDGVSEFMKPSGYTGSEPPGPEPGSNGLILDPEGRLVICEHGDRRISRLEKDGRKVTLVDGYRGKKLNSPNDGVFRSNGDLYFTDPPYGLPVKKEDPNEKLDSKGTVRLYKELDFNGVFRLSADGELTLLTRELTFPNGIALSPDEKTLYVANSDPDQRLWMAYDVKEDGTLGNGRVFHDARNWPKTLEGLPDGMTVDQDGNVYATGPGGVNIFAPDGTLLGRLDTWGLAANCAFGEDGTVLFITADDKLLRIRLTTKGIGFSSPPDR